MKKPHTTPPARLCSALLCSSISSPCARPPRRLRLEEFLPALEADSDYNCLIFSLDQQISSVSSECEFYPAQWSWPIYTRRSGETSASTANLLRCLRNFWKLSHVLMRTEGTTSCAIRAWLALTQRLTCTFMSTPIALSVKVIFLIICYLWYLCQVRA